MVLIKSIFYALGYGVILFITSLWNLPENVIIFYECLQNAGGDPAAVNIDELVRKMNGEE